MLNITVRVLVPHTITHSTLAHLAGGSRLLDYLLKKSNKNIWALSYTSSTGALGALVLTESIPFSIPDELSYISLVPMTWPFDAFKLK